jgi:hypothetical protein
MSFVTRGSACAASASPPTSRYSTLHESNRPSMSRKSWGRLAAARPGERFFEPISHPGELAREGDSLPHGHRRSRRIALRRLEPLMLGDGDAPLARGGAFLQGRLSRIHGGSMRHNTGGANQKERAESPQSVLEDRAKKNHHARMDLISLLGVEERVHPLPVAQTLGGDGVHHREEGDRAHAPQQAVYHSC